MASKGGGRKRDLAWNDVSEAEGENTQFECNYCRVKVSKKLKESRHTFSSDSDNPPIEQSKRKRLGIFLTKTTV